MKALIKSIINEIFPSEDMKNYLSENIDKLWRFRIIDMIAGSMAPLSRKLEMFIALDKAEKKNPGYFVCKDDQFEDEELRPGFEQYAKGIKKAIDELRITSKEDGLLLMQERELMDGYNRIVGDLPFYSFEKFLSYMKEYQQYREEGSLYDWHHVEKYQEDDNGNLEQTYEYIYINGELVFYRNLSCDDYDCWPDENLNLPVPFLPGDIILVKPIPFSLCKKGLILDIGDNCDCCCVQIMHKDEDGRIDTAALKHSSMFYGGFLYPTVSALYTAHIYDGELEENEKFLEIGKEYISGSKDRGMKLWDILPIAEEDFSLETICGKVKEEVGDN